MKLSPEQIVVLGNALHLAAAVFEVDSRCVIGDMQARLKQEAANSREMLALVEAAAAIEVTL